MLNKSEEIQIFLVNHLAYFLRAKVTQRLRPFTFIVVGFLVKGFSFLAIILYA